MQSDTKLISVNVGLPQVVTSDGDPVSTGIFKEPVADRVMLRTLNLDGDRQADLSVHGGSSKAVYVYTHEKHNVGLLCRAIEVGTLPESWRSYFQHRLQKLTGPSLD